MSEGMGAILEYYFYSRGFQCKCLKFVFYVVAPRKLTGKRLCIHKYLQHDAFNFCRFYGMTRRALAELAYRLAERNRIPHKFSQQTQRAGKDWVRWFLQRHRDVLSPRRATPISFQRAWGFTQECVNIFFNNLESVIREKGYQADQIYNMDETGSTIVPVSPSRNLFIIIHRIFSVNGPFFLP